MNRDKLEGKALIATSVVRDGDVIHAWDLA
jgi:hypothetical protein